MFDSALYDYNPRPPDAIPPVIPHAFELALSTCTPHCILKPFHDCLEPREGGYILDRIPKRKAPLLLETPGRELAWGISAQCNISFLHMLFYHFLIFVGTLAFWAWWLVVHPNDLQNASVPVTVALGFVSLLWAAVKSQSNQSPAEPKGVRSPGP